MFIFPRFLRLGLLVPLVLVASVSRADDVPNLRGSYVGAFLPAGTTALRSAVIPYIEQDSIRRLSGEVVIGGNSGVRFPIRGNIVANGLCTCFSTDPSSPAVIHTRWEKLSNGAGGLIGRSAVIVNHQIFNGAMFFFRPMTAGNTPKPSVVGQYAGTYTTQGSQVLGNVTARITDGTSNILSLNLGFSRGQGFVCVGDVAGDGAFAGMGISPQGNFAIIRGYVEQDNLRRPTRFIGEVQIKSPLGQLLETNSIIAILIG